MRLAMSKIDDAVAYGMAFLGVRYRWGGETPMGGFDCSGLVQEILASVGYVFDRDHNSQMMFNHFVEHGFVSQPIKGALTFYGKSPSRISHVGIMANHYQMIEAAGGGSRTHTVDDAIAAKAYVRLRPFMRRSDYVLCYMPNYEGHHVTSFASSTLTSKPEPTRH